MVTCNITTSGALMVMADMKEDDVSLGEVEFKGVEPRSSVKEESEMLKRTTKSVCLVCNGPKTEC